MLLNSGSLPYVSLSEYENLIIANGSCRAFGWDGGTSFRVPTIPALLSNLPVIEYRAMIQLANEATDEAVITATSALQQISDIVPTITYWE